MKIILRIFPDHHGVKLQNGKSKQPRRYADNQRINNRLQDEQWLQKKSKGKCKIPHLILMKGSTQHIKTSVHRSAKMKGTQAKGITIHHVSQKNTQNNSKVTPRLMEKCQTIKIRGGGGKPNKDQKKTNKQKKDHQMKEPVC